MELHNDFSELFELFNKHQVEYIIVGGYALAFHGSPRYTGDIDILVNSSLENAHKIIKSLQDFGFASLGLSEEDFTKSEQVIQLGVPPVRIDILTSISGVSWNEVNSTKIDDTYGDTPVHYISLSELIKNKKATNRLNPDVS